jgi:hypothetical protein
MEQRERGGGVPRLPGKLGWGEGRKGGGVGEWNLLGMRCPWFPSPTRPRQSGGDRDPSGPDWKDRKGVTWSCDTQGSFDDRWGRFPAGVWGLGSALGH